MTLSKGSAKDSIFYYNYLWSCRLLHWTWHVSSCTNLCYLRRRGRSRDSLRLQSSFDDPDMDWRSERTRSRRNCHHSYCPSPPVATVGVPEDGLWSRSLLKIIKDEKLESGLGSRFSEFVPSTWNLFNILVHTISSLSRIESDDNKLNFLKEQQADWITWNGVVMR